MLTPVFDKNLPNQIATEEDLEAFLAQPSATLVDFVKTLPSPLLILGAGGKMGPTLALLVRNAADAAGHPLRVIAASRFTDQTLAARLNQHGIETLSCDLLQAQCIQKLPEAPNILYLVGLKFGTTQNPASTWAVNTIVPTRVAERFPTARIVALSTGNVYPFSNVKSGGALEPDPLTPIGEYANAAVARERIFEFHSHSNRTPIALLRLFYAVELRYGVLVDIARAVYASEPVDLSNGYFNCIWQGDANEMIIRALSLATVPSAAWNLCRPEIFSVRQVAGRFGELFDRPPIYKGEESATALLGNSSALCARVGTPAISLEKMVSWITDWVKRDGRTLGKPTHFESRDGRY
ncbi:MAG TPA: NAD-dependent epimerase/dehydratase family protein [Patescibacteria group bacterium]|nr:NAD-dependent epimerase/dehydratase family protein [Patescibacteria group bacterium]